MTMKDKYPSAAPFFLPYLVPLLSIKTSHSSSPWVSFLPTIFVWIIIPLLDKICAAFRLENSCEIKSEDRRKLESILSFRIAIYLWVPTQICFQVWALLQLSHDGGKLQDHISYRSVSILSSYVLCAAEGINCAHELLHRRSKLERALAEILLSSVCYGHFAVEHSRGHHFRVATPQDPATMKLGQSFYSFLPQTTVGGFKSALKLEKARLRKKFPLLSDFRIMLSMENQVFRSIVIQICIGSTVTVFLGKKGLVFFLLQSGAAIILLEQINAIEHYGLLRKNRQDGSFEAVEPRHSWDCPLILSNYIMFKLQCHSHHHIHASYRYQALQVMEKSPKLPAGYLTLAPMLWIPPLWRFVMDNKLKQYHLECQREGEKIQNSQQIGK